VPDGYRAMADREALKVLSGFNEKIEAWMPAR
jgi:hypothetical protein